MPLRPLPRRTPPYSRVLSARRSPRPAQRWVRDEPLRSSHLRGGDARSAPRAPAATARRREQGRVVEWIERLRRRLGRGRGFDRRLWFGGHGYRRLGRRGRRRCFGRRRRGGRRSLGGRARLLLHIGERTVLQRQQALHRIDLTFQRAEARTQFFVLAAR